MLDWEGFGYLHSLLMLGAPGLAKINFLVTGNHLCDEDIIAIAKALEVNTALQRLTISGASLLRMLGLNNIK